MVLSFLYFSNELKDNELWNSRVISKCKGTDISLVL